MTESTPSPDLSPSPSSSSYRRYRIDPDAHARYAVCEPSAESDWGFPDEDSPSDFSSHDDWVRAKVQESLDDPRPNISHDVAMRQILAVLNRSCNAYYRRAKA